MSILGLESLPGFSQENLTDIVGKPGVFFSTKFHTTDQQLAKAEKDLGIRFGPQTKLLFKKYPCLYYGTTEFRDLELAVGMTASIFHNDDRLDKVTHLMIGDDGAGNHLCVDSNDNVTWYIHDANPVFQPRKGAPAKLFDYIKWDYQELLKWRKEHPSSEAFDFGITVGADGVGVSMTLPKRCIYVVPGSRVGKIKFGMGREEVRKLYQNKFKEFRKSKFAENTADDFHFQHVFYTKDNKVCAVEVFDIDSIFIGVKPFRWFYKKYVDSKLKENPKYKPQSEILSKEKAIAVDVTSEHKVRSVLFGKPGYFTESKK